jgi:superfamily II DNA/RNA helicase
MGGITFAAGQGNEGADWPFSTPPAVVKLDFGLPVPDMGRSEAPSARDRLCPMGAAVRGAAKMPALTPVSDRDELLTDNNAAEANDTAHPEPEAFAAAEDFALSVEQPVGTLGVACIDVPEPGMAAAEGRVPAAIAPDDDADAPEADAETPSIEPAEPEALPLFSDLGLSEPILRAIAEKGYDHPTPIQAQAIPAVLSGRDVMGVAQTGTGKTAGFTLPMLDILSGSRARARMPRSLILEPTRELALQVAENFVAYGKYLKLTHALLIGGESLNDQKDVLMKGVDVLIATPGRLIDLFERGGLMLTDTKLLVIDEADRMLDMGFIPDVEKIVAMLPKTRQTLFFSATMAPEIRRLSDAFLDNPRLITVSRNASVATTIVAGLALVADIDKREALRRLIRSEDVQNALIFCNRKRDVDVLLKSLTKHGFSVGALHGDMSQPARFATLEKFKQNELRLLVCSDVAARGIDIGGLSHVFNFDVPHHAEDYVHRIGRTGRAGKVGHAFTLATPEDRLAVEAIEKLTGSPIPPITVEGLDTVAWAEGKRHGRGGKRGGPPPKRGRGPEPVAAPAPEKPAARAPEPRRQPRPEERRPDRGPRPERSPRPEAERPIAAAPQPDVRSGRDYRRRDEDLGPSVQGFGDEIPAFMLLPWRRDRFPHGEADPEAS